MVHNAVLQEYVVCGEGRGPGCGCRGEEWHGDTEADFGCHCDCLGGDEGGIWGRRWQLISEG